MTDPVERVARALCEVLGLDPDETHPVQHRLPQWKTHRVNVQTVVEALELLDVPVRQLLSGEMVAVDKVWFRAMHDAAFANKDDEGPDAADRAIENLKSRLAKLDYAGGQAVTPEVCFEICGFPDCGQPIEGSWTHCLVCGNDLDEVGTLKRPSEPTGATDSKKLQMCDECSVYPADLPSKLCPGCEAYREHQA